MKMIRKPSLIQQKRTYQYRFIPDTTIVYYITKHNAINHRPYLNTRPVILYSEPYYSKEREEKINSILCYNNIEAANDKCNLLKQFYNECLVDCIVLKDLKYYSLLLRMPLLLEVNSYCDVQDYTEYVDVYYYYKRLYKMNEIFNSDT